MRIYYWLGGRCDSGRFRQMMNGVVSRMTGVQSRGLAVVLASLILAGCTTSDQQAQCREKGLVPGTVEMAACVNPEKAEALMKAKSSWSTLERGERR